MTLASLPPGAILFLGALAIPFLKGRLQQVAIVLIPVLSAAHLVGLPHGSLMELQVFGFHLNPVRIDKLSLVWGYIFHLAAILAAIFALQVKDRVQHVSALIYIGAAVGAVFAGDLVTLFVYWEIAAVSSVFLIWARRTERSYRAGIRYLVVQLSSGLLLLAGIVLRVHQFQAENLPGDPLAFDKLGLSDLPTALILLGFGVKAAFPLLHNWVQDAYPEATVTGTVYLSAFTTKMAIYALARGFPGTEILVWIGALMTAFPIFYAVIENDLRRVLTYSLNNQLGFMVVGVGIGTELSLNGTAAHVCADVIFKGLLFMSMGAVLLRTGTTNGTDLGGLYKSMPWTTGFCIVGAASISAFPLFSAFVTKSMILVAAAEEGYTLVWLILLFASAGVFHHSGIKIPFFAFFAHDSGKRVKEAPLNMLLAMGVAAVLCVAMGCLPEVFYKILPFTVDYVPYTTTHVITQTQLLFFSALAFTILKRTGIYPPELRSVNLDSDWTYRRLAPTALTVVARLGQRLTGVLSHGTRGALSTARGRIAYLSGPDGAFGRDWSIGQIALVITLALGICLVAYFVLV